MAEAPGWMIPEASPPPQRSHAPSETTDSEVYDLLNAIDPDCDYDVWIKAMMAVHAGTGGNGLAMVDEWSAKGSKYKGSRDVETHWKSFKRSGVTIGTLAKLARDHGADLSEIGRRHSTATAAPKSKFFDGSLAPKMAGDEELAHEPADLTVITASSLDGRQPPPRWWIVDGLVPGRVVTLLSGDGGVGKSLLALQLGSAVASGGYWAGKEVRQGRCLYLSAEDDADEIHRRLLSITEYHETPIAGLTDLAIVPLADLDDATLSVLDTKTQSMRPTPLFSSVRREVENFRPSLLVLDTNADFFGGDEIKRVQVRQFLRMLGSLCIRFDLATVLLSHPSLAGINSGSGLSGSTAWNNSVRSRLYLDRLKDKDGSEPDPALRVLSAKKANYGPTGEEIRLRWQGGVFKPATSAAPSFVAAAAQARSETVFLDLLRAYEAEGRHVSATTGHGYAPTIFSRDTRSDGISRKAFEAAMNALFASGKIRNAEYGPPSRVRRKIEIGEIGQ